MPISRTTSCWILAAAVCLIIGFLFPVAPLAAQLAVAPTKFDLGLDEASATQSMRVTNFGRKTMEVSVSVVHWDLDEQNKIRILPPTEQSLDGWMVINPLRFTIAPGDSQTVRFAIRPKVRPEPGEHRAMIFLEQLPGEKSAGMQFLFRVGIGVYGHSGEITRVATLHSLEVEGRTVVFDLTSEGSANVRFHGQYAVWPADRYPGMAETALIEQLDDPATERPEHLLLAGALPNTPVLPGNRRRLLLEISDELPAGSYILDLNGTLGGESIDRAIPFSILTESQPGAEPPSR